MLSQPDDAGNVSERLKNVLWVAGSPCSGKSTISHTITRIYVFLDYHVDALASMHLRRRIAEGDEEASKFQRQTFDERWLQPSVEQLFEMAVAAWSNDFRFVLDDLLAMPRDVFIVAEGNFFPVSVAPYLTDRYQAIWLVPTDAFCDQARRRKQAALAERQKRHAVYNEGSDPEARLNKLIARDQLLARHVKRQADELGLPVYEVDGSRSPDEMTELVERHFDPYLIAALHCERPR